MNMNSGDLLGLVLDNRVRKVVEEHWLESQLEKREIKSLEIEHETKSNRYNWLAASISVSSVET